MCANHHLYPITDESDRKSIFETSNISIGGGMKKSMKNISEPITDEPTPYDVKTYQYTHHVLHENMCIRGLIKQVYCEIYNSPDLKTLAEKEH